MKTSSSLYIIAGPNGTGKTTLAFSLLPDFLKLYDFLNPDEIARGLSPIDPSRGNRKAGEVLLQRVDEYIAEKRSFALETTASGKTYVQRLKMAKQQGYKIHLIYLFVTSSDICIARIRHRVFLGGHNVTNDAVVRRYYRGAYQIKNQYIPLCDTAQLYCCDGADKHLFAFIDLGTDLVIEDQRTWNAFIKTGEKYEYTQ